MIREDEEGMIREEDDMLHEDRRHTRRNRKKEYDSETEDYIKNKKRKKVIREIFENTIRF